MLLNEVCGWAGGCLRRTIPAAQSPWRPVGRWGWTNGKKREEWVNRIEPQTKLMFCLLNYP